MENLGTVEVVWLRRYTEELLQLVIIVELMKVVVLDFPVLFLFLSVPNHREPRFGDCKRECLHFFSCMMSMILFLSSSDKSCKLIVIA